MSVKETVMGIISKILEIPVDEITMESGIGDLPKWDSLAHINIIQEIQDELEVEFEPEEIIDLEDVGDIIGLAEKKGKER